MSGKERAIRFFETVWNERDEEALADFLHHDLIAHPEGGYLIRGLDDYRAWRREILKAMPDLQLEILDALEENDRVVLRWRATATVGGERETFDGMTWMRSSGGKFVEGGDSWNKGRLDAKRAAQTINA